MRSNIYLTRAMLAIAAILLAIVPVAAADEVDTVRLEDEAVRAAVARVAPSVVRIETVGGLERVGDILIGSGPTTGLVVGEDGLVLSSAFNFVQQPSAILVVLPSGARAAATIVAKDHSRSLVLLKVTTEEKLAVPEMVSRADLRVGQWTIAVGRTFEQSQPSISLGVLSAKNRVWGKAIQTDAKISPTNYGGPLIDIEGRVMGILVPMSPQGADSEVAGAEWYDSGIGFAVPLDEVMPRVEAMKNGTDQHAGLLGIAMKQGSIYSEPADILAAQPGSPAAKAGIKAGDKIVECNGAPIVRQAQLKHALGPLYAGETAKLVLLRGEERVSVEAQLVAELLPYSHPFLGLLPMRSATADAGVVIRFVYPDSPAAKAGIVAGDRLTKIGADAVKPTAAEIHEQLSAVDPEVPLALEVVRGSETLKLELKVAKQPDALIESLPTAIAGELPAVDAAFPAGLHEVKLPDDAAIAQLLVPSSYRANGSHGLMVTLALKGTVEVEKWREMWQPLCDKHQLMALLITSSDPARWQPTEAPLVRRLVDEAIRRYPVDTTRVVAAGEGAAAAMALVVATSHRDRFRGVVLLDPPVTSRVKMPAVELANRLSLLLIVSKEKAAVKLAVDKIRAASLPATLVEIEEAERGSDKTRSITAGWIDSLDRL